MPHWCNLEAKESGLECACMNNEDFTVLVSGGSRCHWVSMCTVWPLHSTWLSKESNKSASNFALSLNIPPQKLFGWLRRMQLWATGEWQLHHDNVPAHASFFGEPSNHPGDSVPLQLRFGSLQLLAFLKTKITFEREEASDCQWDFRKIWWGSWWWLGELCGPKVPAL